MQRLRVVPITLVLGIAVASGCGGSTGAEGTARSRTRAHPASRPHPSSTSATASTTTTTSAAVEAVATVVSTSSSTTTVAPPPPPVPATAPGCRTDGTTGPSAASGVAAAPALLADVLVTGGECEDSITFTFRPTAPEGVPPYVIEPAAPPFAAAASGAPIEVPGTTFLRVRFAPAWTADVDTAVLTYTGPDRIDVTGAAAVRAVALYDAYEGVVGWIVGLDGAGRYRVTTATAPPSVTITVVR